jgi:hypothetical protein
MIIVAMAPTAAPCSSRVNVSPCRIAGNCTEFPFARHVSERGPRIPGRVPFDQVELESERFAIAYRLSFTYAFFGVGSSEIAHGPSVMT